MGMSLGTAVLGAVFSSVVSAALIGTGFAGLGPQEIQALPEAARAVVVDGYVQGIRSVFLAASPLALVVLAAALLLRPMRRDEDESAPESPVRGEVLETGGEGRRR